MGEGPDLDEAAVPVGGATVTPNGRTLHIVPGPLPTLDLIFATDTDAARWAKEVTEASLQDTPGKRIDDLVAYIFDQDKHMRDLQQEVIKLRTEHAQVVHERQMVTEIYKQSMDRAKETSLVEKLHASHRKYDRLHERCKHLQEVLLRDGKHVTEEICDNKLLSDHKHHNVHHHHKTHTHPQAPRPDTSKIPDVLKLDSSTSTIGNAFPKCFDVTTTVSNLSPELETPQLEREASSLEGCQSHDVVVDNLRSFEHGGVGSDLTTTAEARLTFPSVSTGCVKFDACQSKSNAQSEMDALAEANLLKQELYQREVAFLAKMNSLEEADAKARRDAEEQQRKIEERAFLLEQRMKDAEAAQQEAEQKRRESEKRAQMLEQRCQEDQAARQKAEAQRQEIEVRAQILKERVKALEETSQESQHSKTSSPLEEGAAAILREQLKEAEQRRQRIEERAIALEERLRFLQESGFSPERTVGAPAALEDTTVFRGDICTERVPDIGALVTRPQEAKQLESSILKSPINQEDGSPTYAKETIIEHEQTLQDRTTEVTIMDALGQQGRADGAPPETLTVVEKRSLRQQVQVLTAQAQGWAQRTADLQLQWKQQEQELQKLRGAADEADRQAAKCADLAKQLEAERERKDVEMQERLPPIVGSSLQEETASSIVADLQQQVELLRKERDAARQERDKFATEILTHPLIITPHTSASDSIQQAEKEVELKKQQLGAAWQNVDRQLVQARNADTAAKQVANTLGSGGGRSLELPHVVTSMSREQPFKPARKYGEELRYVREKINQCEKALNTSALLSPALARPGQPKMGNELTPKLTVENQSLRTQLSATWAQINEQSKRIDEAKLPKSNTSSRHTMPSSGTMHPSLSTTIGLRMPTSYTTPTTHMAPPSCTNSASCRYSASCASSGASTAPGSYTASPHYGTPTATARLQTMTSPIRGSRAETIWTPMATVADGTQFGSQPANVMSYADTPSSKHVIAAPSLQSVQRCYSASTVAVNPPQEPGAVVRSSSGGIVLPNSAPVMVNTMSAATLQNTGHIAGRFPQ